MTRTAHWYNHVALALTMVAAAALLTSCVDRGAVAGLAATGLDVATMLANVYTHLQEEESDYRRLHAVAVALHPPGGNEPSAALEIELGKRILMAQRLGRVYAALGTLSSDKASQDLVDAGQRFGDALTAILPLVGATGPVGGLAVKALHDVGGAMGQLKADQDLGKALQIVAPAPGKVLGLFDAEAPTLLLITTYSSTELEVIAKDVLTLGLVRREDLYRTLSDMYGLPFSGSCTPRTPPQPSAPSVSAPSNPSPVPNDCDKIATALLRSRSDRVAILTQKAIIAIGRALTALSSVQNAQPQGQAGLIRVASEAAAETQVYLKELDTLRTAAQPAH